MNASGRAHGPRSRRLILFGAFDRHNFGDLLLAHCVAALRRPRVPVFAGLAERDLTAFGGHRVRALADVVSEYGNEAADFVHVGGEILTTSAWEAAVMLQTADGAQRAIRACRNADAQRHWAREALRSARRIPYVAGPDDLPREWRVYFRGVGGVALDRLDDDERAEVLRALSMAEKTTVRDARTRDALRRAELRASLVRDAAAETHRLVGDAIRHRSAEGEIAALASRMTSWIAIQLAADRGDDASLDAVARAITSRRSFTNTGVVLFRAGLAPWHDDRETLDRLAHRIEGAVVLESAHMLDICALLAGARAYVGTSLHGWIVADSHGVPARCLVRDAHDKAAAYLDTWSRRRQWRTLDEPDLVPEPRRG